MLTPKDATDFNLLKNDNGTYYVCFKIDDRYIIRDDITREEALSLYAEYIEGRKKSVQSMEEDYKAILSGQKDE